MENRGAEDPSLHVALSQHGEAHLVSNPTADTAKRGQCLRHGRRIHFSRQQCVLSHPRVALWQLRDLGTCQVLRQVINRC